MSLSLLIDKIFRVLIKFIRKKMKQEKKPLGRVWDTELSEEAIETTKKYLNYEELRHKPSLRILDFGCGNGRYLLALHNLFPNAEIHGVDTNADDIKRLQKHLPNVELIEEGKMDIDFPREYFDVIFSSNVIEHIPRRLYLDYVNEFWRILKFGGRVVYGTPNYPYKRAYDIEKAMVSLIKCDFKGFKYYVFDDPTHCNKLNYAMLQKDFQIFKKTTLYPTKIFLNLKNKKYSDKIVGVSIK